MRELANWENLKLSDEDSKFFAVAAGEDVVD